MLTHSTDKLLDQLSDNIKLIFEASEPLKRALEELEVLGEDGAHDISHILRVLRNAFLIAEEEGGDKEVLALSAIFHDSKNLPKDHPDAKMSSLLSAEYALAFLDKFSYPKDKRDYVFDAILNHSFSRGKEPLTKEGKILQDADRLDALGCIGIARCFYVAGSRGLKLYHPNDPFFEDERPLEDKKYSIDHFFNKLFNLPYLMQTQKGRELAEERVKPLHAFIAGLKQEI